MRTVILTRPEPMQADVTAYLTEQNIRFLHLPTLQVSSHIDEPFELHLQRHWSSYHGVMLVSQHAVHFAAERLHTLKLNWCKQVWAAAVGCATANAMQLAWPQASVIYPESSDIADSEALWATLQQRGIDWPSQRILIVRAQKGRDTFIHLLKEAGATVDVWPCYQRKVLPWTTNQYLAFQSVMRHSGAILSITSQEGLLALLSHFVDATKLEREVLYQQPVLTLHPSIADFARSCGFVSVHTSPPSEMNMRLAQLSSYD